LLQGFESDRGRSNLGLLIGRAAEILANRAPETFVTEQSDSRRAARLLPVAETRSVAEDCYLLESRHGYRLLFCRIFRTGE
jgi:hypothetical protein